MGFAWAFFTPLLMLGVYSFVFIGIFGMRWPGAEQAGGIAYALRLFCGLSLFNLFADVIGRAPNLVTDQPNLVKKVVFPLELLSFISIGVALFHLCISLAILLVFTLFSEGLTLSVLLLPIILFPLLPLLLGLSWFFAALGVYIRDLAPLVGIFVNLMLFLSPVFYTTRTLTGNIKYLMRLNPLTGPIENLRNILFSPAAIDWGTWALSLVAGLIVAALGSYVFSRAREGFADVL